MRSWCLNAVDILNRSIIILKKHYLKHNHCQLHKLKLTIGSNNCRHRIFLLNHFALWVFHQTSGTGIAYPSGAPKFTPGFWWGLCHSISGFMCKFCRSLFVFLCFFFWPFCCLFLFSIYGFWLPLRYFPTLLVNSNIAL